MMIRQRSRPIRTSPIASVEQADERKLQNVTPEGLREFGYRVREARIRKGWTLEALAREALNNEERKGYVSQIENGRRNLAPMTIGNLARVLGLPEDVTRPLLFTPAPTDEVTREDRLAENLIRRSEAEATPAPAAEALVIALAYEFAGGRFLDLQTAYTGLRGALQAAAEMKAQIDRLSNMDDQLAIILRRVAELNDQGLRDEAGERLDAAIKAKEAELETLQDAALNQDRLRNRPEAAAQRLVARLKASAPAGGVFLATADQLVEWKKRGERFGDPFDLAVALELARLNHARAKGPQVGQALLSLGVCHLALGKRQSDGGHLQKAVEAFKLTLQEAPRRLQPENWAIAQNNYGNALSRLGEREGDNTRLLAAVAAYEAALTVRTKETAPIDWAGTQNNLGTALRWLGTIGTQPEQCDRAAQAFDHCLSVRTRDDAPFLWARTQWNLADLALARHALSPDPALPPVAQGHLDQAREVFTSHENAHQLAECDRLQTLIDAG